MKAWLTRRWRWAKQNPLFWCNAVLLPCALVLLARRTDGPDDDLHVRLLATALELIGLATVWLDLAGAANRFGKDGVLNRTIDWLKAAISNQGSAIAAGFASIGIVGAKARAKVRTTIDPALSESVRLSNVEAFAQQVDVGLDKALKEIDALSLEFDQRIKKETTDRETSILGLKNELADAAAGNYGLMLFGIVWLALGIVLSNFSEEWAGFMAR